MRETKPYASLYAVAFAATVAMLVIIPLQILAFILVPLPATVGEWYDLFLTKPLAGLFHADFFLMINNGLIMVIYLGFYHSLKGRNRGLAQLAIVLGLVGIGAYISSNKTFELWGLARAHGASLDPAERGELLAAGRAMLAEWQGTAFDAYYVLNGITLLIVSALMLKSPLYGKATAIIGLVAGFFMVVPSTAGTLGLVFSLVSLVPWYVFAIRFSAVFLGVARGGRALDPQGA